MATDPPPPMERVDPQKEHPIPTSLTHLYTHWLVHWLLRQDKLVKVSRDVYGHLRELGQQKGRSHKLVMLVSGHLQKDIFFRGPSSCKLLLQSLLLKMPLDLAGRKRLALLTSVSTG